jgi:hypothetical protein
MDRITRIIPDLFKPAFDLDRLRDAHGTRLHPAASRRSRDKRLEPSQESFDSVTRHRTPDRTSAVGREQQHRGRAESSSHCMRLDASTSPKESSSPGRRIGSSSGFCVFVAGEVSDGEVVAPAAAGNGADRAFHVVLRLGLAPAASRFRVDGRAAGPCADGARRCRRREPSVGRRTDQR